MVYLLLIFGLIFPVISLLSLIIASATSTKDKNVSGVYIPIIGPFLLSTFIILKGASYWWLFAAWLGDTGTVLFLIAAPAIFKDMLSHSSYTRLAQYEGQRENISITLSFHKGQHYIVKQRYAERIMNKACYHIMILAYMKIMERAVLFLSLILVIKVN
jgi:hypothetical protein